MSEVSILGVDCATQLSNRGAVGGLWDGHRLRCRTLLEAHAEALAAWIGGELARQRRLLLALDAPLGWPAALGEQLVGHNAGARLLGEPNRLFRRATDTWVKQHIGQQPLDVGADRIARTALSSLQLVEELRGLTGEDFGLIWSPSDWRKTGVIEVYPAGTLRSFDAPHSAYKGRDPVRRARRQEILEALDAEIDLADEVRMAALANDHDLDALICVLAGLDFLVGRAVPPEDRATAEKEGWIWVRVPL